MKKETRGESNLPRKKGQLYYRATGFTARFISLMMHDAVSQSAIATRLGVSQAAVSSWANGSIPQLRTARALAEIFGVNVDWLLFGEEPQLAAGKSERVINALPIAQTYSPPLSEQAAARATLLTDDALAALAAKLSEAAAALASCAKIIAKASGKRVRPQAAREGPTASAPETRNPKRQRRGSKKN